MYSFSILNSSLFVYLTLGYQANSVNAYAPAYGPVFWRPSNYIVNLY